MDYKGVIIEESLKDKKVLDDVEIVSTEVEKVTEKHKTPWLKKWTLHTVKIAENKAEEFAQKLSKNIDYSQGASWYADFNDGHKYYVIYKNKVFTWSKGEKEKISEAENYGKELGIPEYQLGFEKL